MKEGDGGAADETGKGDHELFPCALSGSSLWHHFATTM